MSNEYFVDYPELLNLNIDYAKDVSLAIDRVGERFCSGHVLSRIGSAGR